MTIEQTVIEQVKRTDLVALVQAKGIALKKNGKGYFGLCPFHADKNPSLSINPTKNLWQCFGCGAAGDAIRFVELFDQVDFKEAVKRLSNGGLPSAPGNQAPADPAPLSAKLKKLLARVIEFYHTAFGEDPRARQYLERRGISDKSLYSAHKIGFANGTLLNALPIEGDITGQLKQIGVLTAKGDEHFYGYATFPLFSANGDPAGIYGRRVEEVLAGDVPDHLYLPGARCGLFNRQAAKAHKEIILTESIIDSLTLINAGIKNTIPCYGTNGLTDDHLQWLKSCEVQTVHVCFDADESGRKAAEKITARLAGQGFTVHGVDLPDGQDINDYFLLTADASAEFKKRLAPSVPQDAQAVKEKGEPAAKQNAERCTATDFGFSAVIDGRVYEARGITRRENKLKATIKGIVADKGQPRLHVDTVDFYSARSRAFLVKGLCDLFGADEKTIAADLEQLMHHTENYHPAGQKPEAKAEPSAKDKQEAVAFLKNPNLFDQILADIETIGYTGEAMNKLLCYIAAVSRKMDEPLSVMIQSRSAAGKSFLQDTVLSLIPEEETIKYTRLTDQALFYKASDSLKHKILAIEELDGMNGAIYSIRSIQSSKKITIAYTGKDPVTGELKTAENSVEGPLMVFITTTAVEIDGETASRFVFISIDESTEMTAKILAKQRQRHTMEGMLNGLKAEAVIKKHRNANRLLAPVKVVNPYAELLTFTCKSLRARRDHTKYLNLIAAISYLFQYQRKHHRIEHEGKTIEYINVTLSDIERANAIANEVLGRSLDELPPPSRALLKLIRQMVLAHCNANKIKPEQYHFTRRQIRNFSGWSDFQVKTHIRQLEELEYIYPVMGKKGKEYVYELLAVGQIDEDKPFLIGLIDMGQLKKKAMAAGITDEAAEPAGSQA
ncbi:MAG: CHC2 zinc finger domain-containing protein [Desulfatitalea sp.]